MWPSIIDRLATSWVRDVVRLRKLLAIHCYGLPRGRVTRPDRRSLLLHGHDAPVAGWLEPVGEQYRLDRRTVRLLFDDHERTFMGDRRAVNAKFGLPAGGSHPEGGEARC